MQVEVLSLEQGHNPDKLVVQRVHSPKQDDQVQKDPSKQGRRQDLEHDQDLDLDPRDQDKDRDRDPGQNLERVLVPKAHLEVGVDLVREIQ